MSEALVVVLVVLSGHACRKSSEKQKGTQYKNITITLLGQTSGPCAIKNGEGFDKNLLQFLPSLAFDQVKSSTVLYGFRNKIETYFRPNCLKSKKRMQLFLD